jgi:uncharacterized Zn finger protein/superfamily II DNA or RNA helicase
MRKKYGTTWWGQQWLNALNQIDYSNRLPRGRTYANKGAVVSINMEGNQILAEVEGSRPYPYQIALTIPRFSRSQKASIIEAITSNPLFISQLLNRQLPQDVHTACQELGVHLFPRTWRDIDGNCSCPDWAVPCKHLAAVLYIVANEIDKNLFLIFNLHGFDLLQGLDEAGVFEASPPLEIRIPNWKDQVQALALPMASSEIWSEEIFSEIDFTRIPDCRDQLLRILGPHTVFFPQGDFEKILRSTYFKAAKAARVTSIPEWDERWKEAETILLTLDPQLNWQGGQVLDQFGQDLFPITSRGSLIQLLEHIPLSQLGHIAPHLRGLVLTYQLARHLAQKSAFIPQLLRIEQDTYRIRWTPAWLQEVVWEISEAVEMLTADQHLVYRAGDTWWYPKEEEAFPALVALFLDYFVAVADLESEDDPILKLFFSGQAVEFSSFEEREQPSSIQLWLERLSLVENEFIPVVLVTDREDDQFELHLAFQAHSTPLQPPIPLSSLLEQESYAPYRAEALRGLAHLTDFFPAFQQLTAHGGNQSLLYDGESFVEVLFEILPTLRMFGVKVVLPKSLQKLLRPQLSVLLEGDGSVGAQVGVAGLDSLLNFQWQVALGDTMVSPLDFREQVANLSGIVRFRDQFVYFDEKEVQKLIRKLGSPPSLKGPQLLQAALAEEYQGARISLDAQAKQIIQDLLQVTNIGLPQGLRATLRPYQQRGYEWLYKNARLGLGSLIADDMGLGKTLQVITLLLRLKEEGSLETKKALIVVPTTLLTNWQKEIERFAPELRAHIYHGSQRQFPTLETIDLLITTYGIARREQKDLTQHPWLFLILDEAQHIKNPGTQQTKSIKQIKAPLRIAMSGTPVENHLGEYWSLMDFANPRYLGGLSGFMKKYARPIEIDRDQNLIQQFRNITAPFILRRLKTDASIIQDLPEKLEQNQYCRLTQQQTALYQSVLETTLRAVEDSEGIHRKGLVLKLITSLKQICNHPSHFLKKGPQQVNLSGKTALLMELLEQILEQEEKVLIFTQYREMGELLVDLLHQNFDLEVPFLHGGVSRKNRDQMVQDFQHNRHTKIFLLSLKAGGTGLNLTAASHVIHYDLWWNPAVENQATDRAYRIGQTRRVQVHRMITQHTFEEKIDQLLQSKKQLAELTVASGEKWIGDLSNRELRALVSLE